MDFEKTFHHKKSRSQGAFLSRLFGIFSEDIVSIWARHKNAPYWNKGRPYVRTIEEKANNERGCVFDFTLEEKNTGKLFVCEQKCELEYQKHKFLKLRFPWQLEHHTGTKKEKQKNRGFSRFLDVGSNPQRYVITAGGQSIKPSGIILIWGAISEKGRMLVRREYKMHDVLSLETIINNLVSWKSDDYSKFIARTREWSNNLFNDLIR